MKADDLLTARFRELAERSWQRDILQHTDFLGVSEQAAFHELAGSLAGARWPLLPFHKDTAKRGESKTKCGKMLADGVCFRVCVGLSKLSCLPVGVLPAAFFRRGPLLVSQSRQPVCALAERNRLGL